MCGRLQDTASFLAHDAHEAIQQKRDEYARTGNCVLALKITGFSLQVFRRRWTEAARVSVKYGGTGAR
jgi:hypothetical protein